MNSIEKQEKVLDDGVRDITHAAWGEWNEVMSWP